MLRATLPGCPSENGYRWYGDDETKRLEAIIAYRSFGVPITQLAPLLNHHDDMTQEQILHDQFNALEREIQRLRQQQKAIVMLLKQPSLLEQNMVTKERWVEIYKITNHAAPLGSHASFYSSLTIMM